MRKPYWVVLLCTWCSSGQTAEPTPDIPQLQWPTDLRARLASGFGERGGKFHGGIDLGVRTIAYGKDGAHTPVPVYAAEYGKVVYRYTATTGKTYGGKGDALIIQHQSGFSTVYGHVDPTVKVGDSISRGQQIGTITKWPDNEHLHFGIHKGAVNVKDPATVDRALKGIYDTAADATKSGALDPLQHTDYPKELIQDVAKKLQAFGGKTDRIARRIDLDEDGKDSASPEDRIARRLDLENAEPLPEPTPPRFIPDGSSGTRGNKERVGPIQFVLPDGWEVTYRNDRGLALGLGGARNTQLFINVGHHPGFPNRPYTPEEVGAWIVRLSWGVGRTSSQRSVTVGPKKLPAYWIAAGDLEGVLLLHAGKVYTINRSGAGAKEAFQKILQSLEIIESK